MLVLHRHRPARPTLRQDAPAVGRKLARHAGRHPLPQIRRLEVRVTMDYARGNRGIVLLHARRVCRLGNRRDIRQIPIMAWVAAWQRPRFIHHDGHSPNGLAAFRSIVSNCISNGLTDISLFGNLSGPLVDVLVILLEADPYLHKKLLELAV